MKDHILPFQATADSAASLLFDRFAAFYDGDYRDYDDDIDALLELAAECGDPILELGCGTGRVMLPLAQSKQLR